MSTLLEATLKEVEHQFKSALEYVHYCFDNIPIPVEHLIAHTHTIEALLRTIKVSEHNASELQMATGKVHQLIALFNEETGLSEEAFLTLSFSKDDTYTPFVGNHNLNIQNIQSLRQILEIFIHDIQKKQQQNQNAAIH